MSGSGFLLKKIIEDGYKTAVNSAAWTYELLYLIHKLKIISRITSSLIAYLLINNLENQILEYKPGKIVVFHFFLIKPVREILRRNSLTTPVIIVVTDPFTAHPIWFLDRNQNFIVFSDILKEKCCKAGIPENRLKVFPFVLDKKFSMRLGNRKQVQIRRELGFSDNSRIILILGGGEGMPKGKKILKKIIRKNMEAEIAIVCGRNRKLYSDAVKIREKYGTGILKVFGFIDFIHPLISISDVVVTKCGASTSMEILLAGKIPVINNYIWEQEKGNMEFVCNRKMGILEKKTACLPDVLNRLLGDSDLYDSLATNIRMASLSNGVGQVSDYIMNFG